MKYFVNQIWCNFSTTYKGAAVLWLFIALEYHQIEETLEKAVQKEMELVFIE